MDRDHSVSLSHKRADRPRASPGSEMGARGRVTVVGFSSIRVPPLDLQLFALSKDRLLHPWRQGSRASRARTKEQRRVRERVHVFVAS